MTSRKVLKSYGRRFADRRFAELAEGVLIGGIPVSQPGCGSGVARPFGWRRDAAATVEQTAQGAPTVANLTPAVSRSWVRPTLIGRAWAPRSRSVADAAAAALLMALAIAQIANEPADVDPMGWVLGCVGALAIVWRRRAPILVLAVSAGSFCLYEALNQPGRPTPLPFLVAVYTLATAGQALPAAVASFATIAGAVGAAFIRYGGLPTDFDDVFFSYVLATGSACALGYGVQVSRTRTELLRQQAARLESAHAVHERQVVNQELNRIARDLHDVVSHQVSVITALAAGAVRVFDVQPDQARSALQSIELCGRDAITEMRLMLRVLRPSAEDGRDPRRRLLQLDGLVRRTVEAGVPVELSVTGQLRPLPAGLEFCAFRIVQEALTNVLKHAGPCHAYIRLNFAVSALEVEVRDTGGGMPSRPDTGQGLIGMQERAALVGGKLTVAPAGDGGVRVLASLPITCAGAAE